MSRPERDPVDRTVCAKCGRTAVTGSAFNVSKLDTRLQAVCPECLYRAERREAADLLASWLLFGLVCGLLAWMLPGRSAPWLGLNLAVIWIMMTATILPHELAHAITARWLRLGRGRICAGIGPLIFHGNLLGFLFLWRALPSGGHVKFHDRSSSATLPRLFLVYAAGPASHLLMAAAAWAFAGAPDWSEFQPRRRLDFAWCFIAANALQCGVNLWPVWGTRYGSITIAGTRGAVFIESGSFAAGEILLREVAEHSPDDTDQGIACLYLAIAASRQGAAKEAVNLAERARALLPQNSSFHSRIEQEFDARRSLSS